MLNPDFKVSIVASDRRKCKHEPDVFFYICDCFTQQRQKIHILWKGLFIYKIVYVKLFDINLSIWTYLFTHLKTTVN